MSPDRSKRLVALVGAESVRAVATRWRMAPRTLSAAVRGDTLKLATVRRVAAMLGSNPGDVE